MLEEALASTAIFAILAIGHDPPKAISGCYADPWDAPCGASMTKDARLRLEGHKGPIIAISRRGLLPQAHRQIAPVQIAEEDVPFGARTP